MKVFSFPLLSFIATIGTHYCANSEVLVNDVFAPSENWRTPIENVTKAERILYDKVTKQYWVGGSGISQSFLIAVGADGVITKQIPFDPYPDSEKSTVKTMGGYFNPEGGLEMICVVIQDTIFVAQSSDIQSYRINVYSVKDDTFRWDEPWKSGTGTEIEVPFWSTDGLRNGIPVFSSDGGVVYISFTIPVPGQRQGISRAFNTTKGSTGTGAIKWETALTVNRRYNGFAVNPNSGILYAGVFTQSCDTEAEMGMHAIDPNSGEILSKWVADTQCFCPEDSGGAFICNTYNSQPIIDLVGNIYAIDELLGVVKFNTSSLSTGPVWNTTLKGQNYYRATFNDLKTRVYASSEFEFGGFDPENGIPDFIEPYSSGFRQRASPVWGESELANSSSVGAVYTTAGDVTQCHDATDGSLLWSLSPQIFELVVVSNIEVVAIVGSSVVSLNTIPPPTEAPSLAPSNGPTVSTSPTLSPISAAPTTGSPTDVPSTAAPTTAPTTAPSTSSGAAKNQISLVAMTMMLVLSHFL